MSFAKILIAIPTELLAARDALLAQYPGNDDLFESDWVAIYPQPSAYSELSEGTAGQTIHGVAGTTHQAGYQQPGFQVSIEDGRWLQEHFLRLIEQHSVNSAYPDLVPVVCRDFNKLLTATDQANGYRERVGKLSEIRSAGSYNDGTQLYNQGYSFKFLENTAVRV